MSDCRIYVACLAAYNDGKLHGAWIDVPHDTDELGPEINKILASSPCPNVMRIDYTCPCGHEWTETVGIGAKLDDVGPPWCPECGKATFTTNAYPSSEEWAIHDHEGFPRTVGENPGLDKLCAYARLVNEHGEAFKDYISDVLGWDYFDADTVEDGFHDAYNGHWESEREFAENQVNEGLFGPIPDSALANYIDYDAIARDLFCGDYVMSDNRHVFRRC